MLQYHLFISCSGLTKGQAVCSTLYVVAGVCMLTKVGVLFAYFVTVLFPPIIFISIPAHSPEFCVKFMHSGSFCDVADVPSFPKNKFRSQKVLKKYGSMLHSCNT